MKNEIIGDLSQVSSDVPPEVKIAVADLLFSFSKLEATARLLLYRLHNLSEDTGRALIGNTDAKWVFDVLKRDIKAKWPAEFEQIPKRFWAALEVLSKLRNLAAHGIWIIVDDHDIQVMSPRLPAPAGKVAGDPFPLERLRFGTRWMENARDAFADLVKRHSQPQA
jgi:hypothetical protein